MHILCKTWLIGIMMMVISGILCTESGAQDLEAYRQWYNGTANLMDFERNRNEMKADMRAATGAYDEAETMYEEILSSDEENFGKGHPLIAEMTVKLARVYLDRGDYEKAEAMAKQALAIDEQALETIDLEFHISLARDLELLADICLVQGRNEEAKTFLNRAMPILQKVNADEVTIERFRNKLSE